jgi:hypothetical protein
MLNDLVPHQNFLTVLHPGTRRPDCCTSRRAHIYCFCRETIAEPMIRVYQSTGLYSIHDSGSGSC